MPDNPAYQRDVETGAIPGWLDSRTKPKSAGYRYRCSVWARRQPAGIDLPGNIGCMHPIGRVLGRILLIERFATDTVGKAQHRNRTPGKMRKQPLRNPGVVIDDVSFSESAVAFKKQLGGRTFIGKPITIGCEKTQRTPRDLPKHENKLPRRLRTRLFVGRWRESADRYSIVVNKSTSWVSRYSKSDIRTNF